jgi:hypothetical protein
MIAVVGGDDAVPVDLQARQRLGYGTRREQDVTALVTLAVHIDRSRGGQTALTLDISDLAGGDQTLKALVEPRDHAVLVLVHPGHVDAVEAAPDAVLGAFAGLVGQLSGVQQRLGGDAAPVQTGAAQLVLLDQGDVQTQLRPTQSSGVPAATASEDH